MNHKRKRPKNRRSGCLMCKSWKQNGVSKGKRMKHSELKQLPAEELRKMRVRRTAF